MLRRFARNILTYFIPSSRPGFHSFAKMPLSEVFETIYKNSLWGGRLRHSFYSGSGSHSNAVAPYVSAVRSFLLERGSPTVVDLGCGDFNVGNQLVDCASSYTACDIVEPLIGHNKRRFKRPNLQFRRLDAVEQELPIADVVLVRQVLQHLSNSQVAKILPKISRFKFAIITEHLPGFEGFVPNLYQVSLIRTRSPIGAVRWTWIPFLQGRSTRGIPGVAAVIDDIVVGF